MKTFGGYLNDKGIQHQIVELWDKPVSYILTVRGKQLYEYEFSVTTDVELLEYRVIFSLKENVLWPTNTDERLSYWSVSFEDHKGRYDVTGDAKEVVFQIFSTVYAIIKDWIKKVKPEAFMFTADKSREVSRSKLYNKMVKSLKPSGYNLDVRSGQDENVYWFRKK